MKIGCQNDMLKETIKDFKLEMEQLCSELCFLG